MKHLLLLFLLTFSVWGYSQTKPVKCDLEKFENRRTTNTDRNRQISEACAAIDNGDYASASSLLDQVLSVEYDKYFDKVNQQLKSYVKESTGGLSDERESLKKKEKEKKSDEGSETKTQPEETTVTVPPVEKETAAPPPPPPVDPPAVAEKTEAPAPSTNTSTAKSDEVIEDNPLKPETKERVFSPEELSMFQEKGQMKLNLFKQYLDKIASRNITRDEGVMAINNAMKLFYGENTYVQVSSVNNPNKPKLKTRTYLERVRALNYDQIEIGWADFQYSPNLRKGPDGNYYGYITFRQRFRGSKDGKVVYEDVTDKTIAVILKVYDKYVEGVSTENFEVFLGDMDVVQTSKE